MSATIGANTIWSQELQVHWPKSWRFLASRDVLLEMFRPQIFSVQDDTIFLRYGENQDLRVSQLGMHIRIIAHETLDNRAVDVFSKVLKIVEPTKLNEIEATFAHVHPIEEDYDLVRRELATVFYAPWIQKRPIRDFALLWDEHADPEAKGQFSAGVVNAKELVKRVAKSAGSSVDALGPHLPAWMKVRLPAVAIFMESQYASTLDVSVDLAPTQVPQIWWEWRERSSQLFNDLTDLVAQRARGETREHDHDGEVERKLERGS